MDYTKQFSVDLLQITRLYEVMDRFDPKLAHNTTQTEILTKFKLDLLIFWRGQQKIQGSAVCWALRLLAKEIEKSCQGCYPVLTICVLCLDSHLNLIPLILLVMAFSPEQPMISACFTMALYPHYEIPWFQSSLIRTLGLCFISVFY